MYDTYIKEKISEKYEYDINLIIEYLIIYLKLFFCFIDKKENRIQLTKYIKEYLKYTKKEYELLKRVKRLNCKFEHDNDVVDILDKLEQLFIYNFNEIETVLSGYENALTYKNILYSSFKEKRFDIKYLDDSIERIKGMEI